ncbi:MAG: metallophosphoesterase, partial [Acidimicrobiales bacterium]
MPELIVALVTDTHVRPVYDDGQLAFASDASHNDRNGAAAAAIRAMKPDLVVHLGDVVHPIPTLDTHADALEVATEIYSDLGAPMVVVPGNHDVGDKAASAYAPVLVSDSREFFMQTWGAPFQSFDMAGLHFVTIDGGLLGAATNDGEAQWAWLEKDLRSNQARCFVFTHYPPFLVDPEEDEHYDNLAPSVRSRLLDLLVENEVEALFSGHVHRFFLNELSGVELVSLPSVVFTRPEYSALRPVPPSDAENGRDDREQLGVCKLTITESGYRLEVVRTQSETPGPPAAPKPLGVWLRHRLGRRAELPYGDLDALNRKVARDEAALLQVLDLGLSHVRLPLADLRDPDVRFRLEWLKRHGVAAHVFSGGLPTTEQRELLHEHGHEASWEVVIRDGETVELEALLKDWDGPQFAVGRIGKNPDSTSRYFSHFPREGFDPSHPALEGLAAAGVRRFAFRIAAEGSVDEQVETVARRVERLGVTATCHVELPFLSEAQMQTDDALVTDRVLD